MTNAGKNDRLPRSERLFRLQDLLRRGRPPITANALAAQTGTTKRTIYRDIESLRAMGFLIDGEAGFGYALVEDPTLPPQSFGRTEIEALGLGLSALVGFADPDLIDAGQRALDRITATLPTRGQQQMMHSASRLYQYASWQPIKINVRDLRQACWDETEVKITYRDGRNNETSRQVRPLSIAFWGGVVSLIAYCTLRSDFRIFHLHRIGCLSRTETSFRPNRAGLLREFGKQAGQRHCSAQPQ